PRQESNLYLKFRKLLFYPLNYGANYLLYAFQTILLTSSSPETSILSPSEWRQSGGPARTCHPARAGLPERATWYGRALNYGANTNWAAKVTVLVIIFPFQLETS